MYIVYYKKMFKHQSRQVSLNNKLAYQTRVTSGKRLMLCNVCIFKNYSGVNFGFIFEMLYTAALYTLYTI